MKKDISVADFGAKGDGIANDTNAFKKALNTKSNVYVPEGTYWITESLTLSPFQSLVLNSRAILKFTDNSLISCITMSMSSRLEGGLIEVNEYYKNSVILYDTAINKTNFAESYPFTFNANDVLTRYGIFIFNVIIQKNAVRPRNYSTIGGIAIKCIAREETYGVMWGNIFKNIRINGGFENGIHLESSENKGTWIHDTFITNVIMQYTKLPFYLLNVNCVYITEGAFQPGRTLDGKKYVEHGIAINKCNNITVNNYNFWDFTESIDGNTNKVFMLYNKCSGIKIFDLIELSTLSECRVHYNDFETALSLDYYTRTGKFLFPEVLNYRDYQKQAIELRKNVVNDTNTLAYFEYNIPVYSALNIFDASDTNPKYIQLGYLFVPQNASSEIYRINIQDNSINGILGYSTISIKTDKDGTPILQRFISTLENTKLFDLCDYVYTYTIENTQTKVTLYRKYTRGTQDMHHFIRSITIKSAYRFITEIITNANPTDSKLVYKNLSNPYEYDEKPSNAAVGYSYFSKVLGKPIWCKTAAVFDNKGKLVTAGTWVDSMGNKV
ncbi:glycosyl hydrolase family 28-related protein [Priestia megaterium]|uniref:glycosyl hydrolase family 28-related protein n=1 Tax=Priestia megaterium TaxID=1404 RepID=UPI00244B24A1|nr:glycosyl hydrolase family 28-related protein [Priestia megaterium]MDH2363757.1 glycosyl hydrolase family 28-related protein [Priestia megaterium]